MGYKKWCPNGCGIKVCRDLYCSNQFEKLKYKCEKCGKRFSMEELMKFRKGE